MPFQAKNPATGEMIREVRSHSRDQAREKVERGHAAFQEWSRLSFRERGDLLQAAGRLLHERTDRYGRLITEEMGKPLVEAVGEVEKCALGCEFYAENAARFLATEEVETDARRSEVAYRPLGVILAIMPWNFPFWQVFRFSAPALMAGNTVLVKQAPNVPGCMEAMDDLMQEAGFPEGVFQALFVEVEDVPPVIQDPRVRAVTLTGSTGAGRAVAEEAGRNLKKTVLELGGSDPYLILADAELESTVETCVQSRLMNSGQSCIAAKRFLVEDAIREPFQEALVARLKEAVVGDPLDERTDVGPLARPDLRKTLHRQVEESVAAGARLLMGGRIPEGAGNFYPVTVLSEVAPRMPAYEEELFGPVAAIIGVRDEAHGVQVANDTSYGLGGAVFTQDRERGRRIATEEIDSGACFVNGLVRSDPQLPFGGVKDSGYGRELSYFGIREFVNVKTVSVW